MARLYRNSNRPARSRLIAAAVLLLMTFAGTIGSPLRAAELADQAHSLRNVPADVAYYSTSLRLKEQFDLFAASNAYRKLMEIPVVQMAKMQLEFQWQQSPNPVVERVREYFDSAEGQETLALVKEMFSEETFSYANQDIIGLVQLFMEFNGLNRAAKIEALATGEEEQAVLARKVMEMLNERAEQFVVPDMVWGFRVQDADRAAKHLDRVQELLQQLLDAEQPELAERLRREQIAGHEFLTLRLDGEMIPWDQLRDEAEDMTDEQFAQWQELLNKKTLAAALGVVDEFVLLSIGKSTDHLARLGSGPTLAEKPIMARLARHADERVTAINYVSQKLAKSLSSPRQTIEEVVTAVDEALGQMEVPDQLRGQLVEDAKGLGDDIAKYIPQPGDVAAVSYLTSRGYETFQYQTGTRPMQDASQPLTVLEHVGGRPAMFLATRQKQSVESYDETVAWIKRVAGQVELVAKEQAQPDDWAKYLELREKGLPLLERWNAATRTYIMPAFADGQQAVVIDVAAESTQWFAQMPKSPQPLPMLEIGFVASVSDAEQVRQGVAEYFQIIQDALGLLHELNPDEVAEFHLPSPEIRQLNDGGTVYSYALPPQWNVDPQLAPNGAVSDSVAAASLTPALTERLLRTKPLQIDSSLDLKRPAAAVSYLGFAQMIEAVRPWVDYGGGVATGQIKDVDDDQDAEQTPEEAQAMMAAGMFLPQIHQVLEVATALRSLSSVVYREEDAWVTHSELHLRDLE